MFFAEYMHLYRSLSLSHFNVLCCEVVRIHDNNLKETANEKNS